MVGLFLIVQMADPCDVRRVAVFLGPFDGLMLSFEGRQDVICVILDDVVSNRTSFGLRLWPSLYEHISH